MKLLLCLILFINSAYGTCINPNLILSNTNPLLTRYCSWVDTTDLWRTQNIQYNTVFLGDSMVARGNFPGNMGIGGDTTQLVLQRLDIALNAHPTDIYLWIGTNDLWRGSSTSRTLSLYTGIINSIKAKGIRVHVISTIHCNSTLQPSVCPSVNSKVGALNDGLKQIPDIDFIDVDSVVSVNNNLMSQYTLDGIHLNNAGYALLQGLL